MMSNSDGKVSLGDGRIFSNRGVSIGGGEKRSTIGYIGVTREEKNKTLSARGGMTGGEEERGSLRQCSRKRID